jgi:hypothetical protein
VGQPQTWTSLAPAVDAQAWWYATLPAPTTTTSPVTSLAVRPHGTHRGYATSEECVGAVENGGDYGRSSNPGHFGRYQFSRPAWATYGGNPDTWGSASPADQDTVFANAVAADGLSNWLPYDGC